MRAKTELFQINGKPMLVPDTEVATNYSDLEGSDSGKDASGILHAFVLRYKIGSWKFIYNNMTAEEMQYMESIFPDTATFSFQHPSRWDASASEQSVCYRRKFEASLKNTRPFLWSRYEFTIFEC